MCGFAGEVRFDGGVSLEHVDMMAARLLHRGPDDNGSWRSANGNCAFSFRRLSIIDLSPAGHQPMVDPQTGNALVFNGEIYNFKALRDECIAAGDGFRSLTDTEVILNLYRRYGTECIGRLRGMFAFALWDAGKRELFLVRDRLGKKPLHYALTSVGLIFCSEIDPLSLHPNVPNDIDLDALDLYLQLQHIPYPWTIYRHIRKLPPAHFAVLSATGMRLDKYWSIDYRNKLNLTETEALEALEEKLTEAVRLRMIADVPLGALLSGGVDSSIVVATMAKLSGAPVKTFSVGFEEQQLNELPYANEVAATFCTEHHPQIIAGGVNQLLPKLIRHYGEPYADSSAIPSFFVCEAARSRVTVALNGDGGDELLGGYSRYEIADFSMTANQTLGRVVSAETLIKLMTGVSAGRFIPIRAIGRLMRQFIHPELGAIFSFAAFWTNSERRALLPKTSKPALTTEWHLRWLQESAKHADNPIDKMLFIDQATYLPDDLLVKMDIASMHCSLETRSPLLDHKLIEFCAALPPNLKVRHGVGKYLLKKYAERIFPRPFIYRRKMGFGIPLGNWLRGPLREMVLDTIFDSSLMEPLESKAITRTAKKFYSGPPAANDDSRLWCLFMFGLWRAHGKARAQEVSKSLKFS